MFKIKKKNLFLSILTYIKSTMEFFNWYRLCTIGLKEKYFLIYHRPSSKTLYSIQEY